MCRVRVLYLCIRISCGSEILRGKNVKWNSFLWSVQENTSYFFRPWNFPKFSICDTVPNSTVSMSNFHNIGKFLSFPYFFFCVCQNKYLNSMRSAVFLFEDDFHCKIHCNLSIFDIFTVHEYKRKNAHTKPFCTKMVFAHMSTFFEKKKHFTLKMFAVL